ncbi:hypothetical protein [Hathewaya massiliensis]|uniref:hypothetical protein n=1 Tax=Hathewaya massiliensis TaxID=1964382 RepID=UPI00115B9DAE|nr:hypothetical protein [Hathewaya massiliensis]
MDFDTTRRQRFIKSCLKIKIYRSVGTSGFEIDEHSGHQTLCNMIYPYDDIKKGIGYHQLEIYVPIKLKGEK